MVAYLNFNGTNGYLLESYLVEHQKDGDPSAGKGKGNVNPLKVGVITVRVRYSNFTKPAAIKTLIDAAFNKKNGTKYHGSIEVHSDDGKSTIDFKNAQVFSYSESGDAESKFNNIELTILAQDITHHGKNIKFEDGLSV